MNVITRTDQKVINALATISKDANGYYRFGSNDELINEIIDIVNSSGTASSCIGALARFTSGNGLADVNLGNSKANALQTNNSALSELALNVAYSECVAFRVLYSNDGQPARYYPVPIQTLRRKGKKTFLYNELMGYRGYRITSGDRWLSAFDPTESPQARMDRMNLQLKNYNEQVGDIVYYFKRGVGKFRDVYPVPGYYAGLPDIESDAGISILERRNIKRGWKTSVIISTGPIDKETKDGNGNTQFDKFVATIKRFAEEDAAVALHLEGATNEAKPEVKTLNVADVLNATDQATERVGRKVCRLMGVPPILVGFSTAGQLGNTQELKNTMDLFRLTVIERQTLIKEAMKLVFPNQNWELTTLNLWNEAVKV
jgi:hypothetical protein